MYPIATGAESYHGKTVPNAYWSRKMVVKYYEATVLGEITNTDWEDEIQGKGSVVKIRNTPNVNVEDHSSYGKINYQQLSPDTIDLVIEHGKQWAFRTDDVERYLSDYEFIDDWTEDAAEQIKIKVDRHVLQNIVADAHAQNSGAQAGAQEQLNLGTASAPITVTKHNIIEWILKVSEALDDSDVPAQDRSLVIPPTACNLLLLSDLKDASLAGDDVSQLRTGYVKTINGIKIYKSRLLSYSTSTKAHTVPMLHKRAVTFAGSLSESEALRGESQFGDLFRGLFVYGFKTVKPEGLATSVVKFSWDS